jgi:hypothetical protein
MVRIRYYQEEKGKPQKYWHPYTLQSLNCEKFAKIVNKILNGEHFLMRLDRSIKFHSLN